ncbi:hypothetical protein BIW11_11366 [Tropilaelaps mercedesae]|uniref:Uncharacterized protein n=1 Tax=Tropilaelaps mercedesae TaxID=418985 RepID=A0A1V9XBD3_9ACAR|nr:hypothetical protein BIW11_11366 [Tropilaelaps mercedesae]
MNRFVYPLSLSLLFRTTVAFQSQRSLYTRYVTKATRMTGGCTAQCPSEQKLFNEFCEWRFEDSPEFATMFGVHRYDDKLESYTLASFEARRTKVCSFLERAKQLRLEKKNKQYSPASYEDLDLFIEILQVYLDGYATRSYLFPLSTIDGLNVDLPLTISYMKFATVDDVSKLTRRLRAFPAQIEGVLEVMREGIRSKMTLHSVSLKNMVETLTDLIEKEPSKTPYYR